MSGSAATKPSTASQMASAGRNIGITVVVLAVIFFAYSRYVQTSKQLKQLRDKITEKMKHDSPADYQAAAALLDQGLDLRSSEKWFIMARGEVAALLWVEGGYVENKPIAEKYLAIAEHKKLNRAERFDAEGLILIGDGQVQDAADKLTAVVERASAAPASVIADLGIAHERLGKLESAKNDLKQAADRDWVNPRYGALYAEVLFDDGEYVNAQSIYQKTLEASPNHARSIIGRARADVARNERVAESLKTINEVLANPADLSPVLKVRALDAKAEAQLAGGDAAGAEASARQALDAKVEGDSGTAYAQYDLGIALAQQKKPGALDSIKKAIGLVPYIPHFYFNGALALAKAGQIPDGGALLDQYAKKITDAQGKMKADDAYHRAKGDFLAAADKPDDAIKEYELAIKDNPVNADSFFDEALVIERQARDAKGPARAKLQNDALSELNKAVEFRPTFPEVFREAGMIYMDGSPGDPKAMQNFTKALLMYKQQRAPKVVTDAFIAAVEERLTRAGGKFKATAAQWHKEANDALAP